MILFQTYNNDATTLPPILTRMSQRDARRSIFVIHPNRSPLWAYWLRISHLLHTSVRYIYTCSTCVRSCSLRLWRRRCSVRHTRLTRLTPEFDAFDTRYSFMSPTKKNKTELHLAFTSRGQEDKSPGVAVGDGRVASPLYSR